MKRREFLACAAAAPFVMNRTLASALESPDDGDEIVLQRNVVRRELLDFAMAQSAFLKGKGEVAFLGGSITEMEGYRPMVCEYLKKKFPETDFNFVAAGIGSTCSDVGAFRLETDVLEKCRENFPLLMEEGRKVPDLFFVEFAVNDDQDGFFSEEHAIRGMEGVVRHVKSLNPYAAIVMTFFVNENLMDAYRRGETPTSIRAHEAVAKEYGVSTVNLAREIQQQIDEGKITWQEFGGVHPAPRGNRVCADMIAKLLDAAWDEAKSTTFSCGVRDIPMKPLDEFSYCNAGWRGFDGVTTNIGAITDATPVADGGFRLYTPDWSKIPGAFRARFGGAPCLCAEKPGAEATFEIDGNAAILYLLAGPDAGSLECQVDDGETRLVDAFHPYSRGLHYPRAVVLADALDPGKHIVKIRLSEKHNPDSAGTAIRIMQIGVNRH